MCYPRMRVTRLRAGRRVPWACAKRTVHLALVPYLPQKKVCAFGIRALPDWAIPGATLKPRRSLLFHRMLAPVLGPNPTLRRGTLWCPSKLLLFLLLLPLLLRVRFIATVTTALLY